MTDTRPSILSDFLSALEVPHTRWYSDSAFASMTFRSLFGLNKVLEDYHVPTETVEVADKAAALDAITVPYLARMADSFVIVTDVSPTEVTYMDGLSDGKLTTPRDAFTARWSGVVMMAFPTEESIEPDYASHRFTEIGNKAKGWVLAAAAIFILAYLTVTSGVMRHVSTGLLWGINLIGLYVTYQLVLKSMGVHTRTADRICGVIDRNGCHTVLGTPASKFFGIFGWSEVGLAYFTVSLGTLVIFPEYIGYLALINAICCPFSIWSVWYQKYRAKAWCTLCLVTQACLWTSLACYLLGGWFASALPIRLPLFVIGAAYIAVMLTCNAIMSKIRPE